MKNIGGPGVQFPAEAAVMPLPNALLLPNTVLPLFIFEPRYREMLAYSLEHERMFCVALMKPGGSEAAGAVDFFRVGGLGLIRACVNQPDGTSHLILQGLVRVEFLEIMQEEPFRIARIRELKSELPNVVESEALAAKVVELCRGAKMEITPKFARELTHLSNPSVLADVVTNTFVTDTFLRQQLLEETEVSERLRLLIRYLADGV